MEKVAKRGVKKLLMSVLVMVVAIAAAGTSTFAWFTTNATPRIEEYESKVTAVDGLYIALTDAPKLDTSYTALDYKANITKAEIEALIKSTGVDALSLVPATTTDGVAFKDLNGVAIPATGIPVDANDDERGYFSYTIYFKAKEEVQIGLDFKQYAGAKRTYVESGADGDVAAVVPNEWLNTERSAPAGWTMNSSEPTKVDSIDLKEYLGGSTSVIKTPGQEITAKAADAVRLSFTGVGNFTTSTAKTVSWNPRKTAADSYQLGNLALDLYDSYNTTKLADYTEPTNMKNLESDFDTEVLVKTETEQTGFYYGYITIKQWIEGYDGDCLNGIMADVIKVGIQFKTIA